MCFEGVLGAGHEVGVVVDGDGADGEFEGALVVVAFAADDEGSFGEVVAAFWCFADLFGGDPVGLCLGVLGPGAAVAGGEDAGFLEALVGDGEVVVVDVGVFEDDAGCAVDVGVEVAVAFGEVFFDDLFVAFGVASADDDVAVRGDEPAVVLEPVFVLDGFFLVGGGCCFLGEGGEVVLGLGECLLVAFEFFLEFFVVVVGVLGVGGDGFSEVEGEGVGGACLVGEGDGEVVGFGVEGGDEGVLSDLI